MCPSRKLKLCGLLTIRAFDFYAARSAMLSDWYVRWEQVVLLSVFGSVTAEQRARLRPLRLCQSRYLWFFDEFNRRADEQLCARARLIGYEFWRRFRKILLLRKFSDTELHQHWRK